MNPDRHLTLKRLPLLSVVAGAMLCHARTHAAVEVERAAGTDEVVMVRNLDAYATPERQAGLTFTKDFARVQTSTLASSARAMAVAGRDPVLLAQQFLREHGGKFCPAPSELKPFQVERDELGMTHVRYEQRIGGLPVLGSGLIVHVGADGAVTCAGGRVAPRVQAPAVGPWAVDADRAGQIADQQAAAEGAVAPWQLRTVTGPFVHVAALQGGGEESGVVVWKVVLLAEDEEAGGRTYLVDARTGDIRFREEMTHGMNRFVTDCANPQTPSCKIDKELSQYRGYVFGRSEGQPQRGSNPFPGFSGLDTDNVYDLIPVVENFWRVRYGRNGMNNRGGLSNPASGLFDWSYTPLRVNIDARPQDVGCANGASFTVGNGSINLCHGKYSDDVVGHEYSHGLPLFSITDGSGNPLGLTYQWQSGALNEGQAYLWGEIFELFHSGTINWLTYSSIAARAGKVVLNLSDPTSTEIGPMPDRFNSSLFYCGTRDNGGVHENSGPVAKAFYLIAQGGGFNGCTVSGLGTDEMSNILYRAITRYYTPNTTFNAAYAAILQAATDLYPNDVAEVRKALQSVELDQAGFCSNQPPRIPRSLDLEGW